MIMYVGNTVQHRTNQVRWIWRHCRHNYVHILTETSERERRTAAVYACESHQFEIGSTRQSIRVV